MVALIDALRQYSKRWGSDPGLVQGAGGNTSIKMDGNILVKASGTRLADAEKRQIFVKVDLSEARAMADGGLLSPCDDLRPSIETSLHAVMPQRIVAHLHMVSVLAFAVRIDAEAALQNALAGMRWSFLPYIKPGAPVARAVRQIVEHGAVDILVLGNHGVVFGGDSFEEIDALIAEVDRRLSAPPRGRAPNVERLEEQAARLGLEVARFEDAHLAANDATNLAFATTGTLYPDHVVFLGRRPACLEGQTTSHAALLYLDPEVGALLAPHLPDEAHEMAACLGAVVSRIASGAKLSPLTTAQEDELVNWDAEIYRRTFIGASLI